MLHFGIHVCCEPSISSRFAWCWPRLARPWTRASWWRGACSWLHPSPRQRYWRVGVCLVSTHTAGLIIYRGYWKRNFPMNLHSVCWSVGWLFDWLVGWLVGTISCFYWSTCFLFLPLWLLFGNDQSWSTVQSRQDDKGFLSCKCLIF